MHGARARQKELARFAVQRNKEKLSAQISTQEIADQLHSVAVDHQASQSHVTCRRLEHQWRTELNVCIAQQFSDFHSRYSLGGHQIDCLSYGDS